MNALLTASALPFQAPPFDTIADTDFRPAFEEAMRLQMAEVEAIANNPAVPTFENTLVALEQSGQAMMRVSSVFGVLSSANTNDVLQRLQQDIASALAGHYDAIRLNPKLFARIESVYGERELLALDVESKRLLEVQLSTIRVGGGASLGQ